MFQTSKQITKRRGGFTLLELITAIALMDVVAICLYSSMYIGVKAKKSSYSAIEPLRMVQPVWNSLKYDLNAAMRPRGLFAGQFLGSDERSGNGLDADVLSFYVSGYQPSDGEKVSNVVKIEYLIETDAPTGLPVLKKNTTLDLLASSTSRTKSEVLLRNVRYFDVKFYDGYSWLDSWDSTVMDDKAPAAVWIYIGFVRQGIDGSLGLAQDQIEEFSRLFILSSSEQDFL